MSSQIKQTPIKQNNSKIKIVKKELTIEEICANNPGSSIEEIKDIQTAFRFLDKDNSGLITVNELKQTFGELGLMNDNKMLYSIMAGIDEDHDGTINFEEFLKISLTKFSEINSRKEAAQIFSFYDPDEDGKVSLNELKKMGHKLGENLTNEQYQEMFRRADLDGDGFVNQEDFYNILTGKVYYD